MYPEKIELTVFEITTKEEQVGIGIKDIVLN